MKTLIFLIFLALVVFAMYWTMRKSQAKADLERSKSLERQKKQRKEAITPEEHVTWPVIIGPVRGYDQSAADSEIEEPSMTSIEFEPQEKISL